MQFLALLALLHVVTFGQYCPNTSSQPFELNTLEGEANTGGNDGIAAASIGFSLDDAKEVGYWTLCTYASNTGVLTGTAFHPCNDSSASFQYPANGTIVVERVLECGGGEETASGIAHFGWLSCFAVTGVTTVCVAADGVVAPIGDVY